MWHNVLAFAFISNTYEKNGCHRNPGGGDSSGGGGGVKKTDMARGCVVAMAEEARATVGRVLRRVEVAIP